MRIIKSVANLIVLIICLNLAVGLALSPARSTAIQQSANSLMAKYNIPGLALLIYEDGKPYSFYFGYANENKKIPITDKTIFELGSISKIMTSLLLAQQIDAARVGLKDPIRKFLPELPEIFADINFQELATNTSGLPFNAPDNITNRTQLTKFLKHWIPDNPPGDLWIYSNFGVGLLGYSLETVTHKNFNQLYRSHILAPLHMQAIALTVPKTLDPYYAQGHDRYGKPVKPLELGLFPAAYGIKASAKDMHQFLRAAIGLPGTPERIFYPMRLTQSGFVKLPDKLQGLAWDIHKLNHANLFSLRHEASWDDLRPIEIKDIIDQPKFDGNTLLDKTGNTKGFSTYIAVLPNKKSGIVLLANKNIPGDAVKNLGREILFKLTR